MKWCQINCYNWIPSGQQVKDHLIFLELVWDLQFFPTFPLTLTTTLNFWQNRWISETFQFKIIISDFDTNKSCLVFIYEWLFIQKNLKCPYFCSKTNSPKKFVLLFRTTWWPTGKNLEEDSGGGESQQWRIGQSHCGGAGRCPYLCTSGGLLAGRGGPMHCFSQWTRSRILVEPKQFLKSANIL